MLKNTDKMIQQTSKHILGSNSFWMVNKKLAKYLNDIQSVVLLTYLVDKEDYHRTRNELIDINGKPYFFAVSAMIEKQTTLSYKQQKRCFKILDSCGLVNQKLIGLPAKLHFTICHSKICQIVTSSIDQREILDVTKGITNTITDLLEQNNNNISTIEQQKVNSKELTAFPEKVFNDDDFGGFNKFDEKLNGFIKEKTEIEKEKSSAKKEKADLRKKVYQDQAVECMNLLNSLTGRKMSSSLTGRGSDNVKYLVALFKKGYSFDEVKLMIQYKCWEWGDSPKMKPSLRPITLFKRHGARYIEEANEAKDNPAFQNMLKDAKSAEDSKSVGMVAGDITRGVAERLGNL